MDTHRIAVIMAGGSGERFWPLSRRTRPKQLLRLTNSDRSLLAEAVERIKPAIPPENVFVATGRHLQEPIRRAGLGLPDANVIAEPCKRNTAGCLCYAAAAALARYGTDKEISMAVLTADHRIGEAEKFCDTVLSSLSAAEQNEALVTIGIRPTRPETGYGYIEMNANADPAKGSAEECPVFPVVRFLEKPDRETAQRFLAAGHYLWNSGMFFWRASVFVEELRQARPAMADAVDAMANAMRHGKLDRVEELFAELPDISIDYALMERAGGILVAPADFPWDDLGSWDSLERTFPADEAGNVTVGDPVLVDCENSIVYNDVGATKMAVSVVGIKDVVVVVSEDAVLVVPKNQAQRVKDAVKELKRRDVTQL